MFCVPQSRLALFSTEPLLACPQGIYWAVSVRDLLIDGQGIGRNSEDATGEEFNLGTARLASALSYTILPAPAYGHFMVTKNKPK